MQPGLYARLQLPVRERPVFLVPQEALGSDQRGAYFVTRGFDNNLYTQIGLVLMIALASKNAILVVEFARDLQREGISASDAAIEGTSRWFRPIMMNSLAFILGVVPLLFDKEAGAAGQQAIGNAVFGGMLASTLLAIPFVPSSTSSCNA